MGRVRIARPFVLLALAVLLAPRAEASRTSVWESNPPSSMTATKSDAAGLLASLAPAAAADVDAEEPPRFDLGDITFVGSALEHEDRFDFGPLDPLGPTPLRGPPPSYPETRVGSFELLPPFRVGASPRLSLWSRQACGSISCGVVSDGPEDPWGLAGEEQWVPKQVGNTLKWVKQAAQDPNARQTTLRFVQAGGAGAAGVGAGSSTAAAGAGITAGTVGAGVAGGLGVAALFTATVGQFIPAGNHQSIAQWWGEALFGTDGSTQARASAKGVRAAIFTEDELESPYLTQLRSVDPGSPQYQSLLRLHKNYVDITRGTRTPRAIHDEFLNQVRPGAKEVSFPTPWSASRGLGTRKFDDYDPVTKTGFEANTTPWSEMSQKQLSRKLDQVASDWVLRRTNPDVQRIIWFGTEPLSDSGLGAKLREALREAGIPYWVVPPQ